MDNERRGTKNSDYHNQRLREANVGRHHTDEAKEKNRLAHLGKKQARCSCVICKKDPPKRV